MLWIKAFHMIALVAWFAGLFYLPRLFVYHAEAQDKISLARFEVMERRLYVGIMWPAALLTTLLGFILLAANIGYYVKQPWMHAKLALVVMLWIVHSLDGYYIKQFKRAAPLPSALFFRFFNEAPTVLLIAIVILVIVQPALSFQSQI